MPEAPQPVRRGRVVCDGWAGRYTVPVEILGETPRRFRCRLVQESKLPGRANWKPAGHIFLAPKGAVRIEEPQHEQV